MTALTVEADRSITGGEFRRYPSETSANPYVGSALSYNSAGNVHELVAGEPFAGFCMETIQTKDAATATGSRYIDATAGVFRAILPLSSVAVADINRPVYATDDNAFTFTKSGASTLIGRVIGVESSTRAIVQCQTSEMSHAFNYSLTGAGTALTNSTTRTALASYTIKAGTLRAGSRIRVRAHVIATSTNSTDTLLLDIGGAVGGTPAALCSSSAVDVANNDIGYFDLDIVIRTIGASGTLVIGGGQYTKTLAQLDTAVAKPFFLASTTVDTTADIVLGIYGTWSVASASNSCRADVFNVDVIL